MGYLSEGPTVALFLRLQEDTCCLLNFLQSDGFNGCLLFKLMHVTEPVEFIQGTLCGEMAQRLPGYFLLSQ